MTNATDNLPATITRVRVDGPPTDPGSVTINASDGFIAILRDAGYTVTPV